MRTKYYSFEQYASAEYAPGLKGQVATQLMTMYRKAAEVDSPVILELGTSKGSSTTVFLQACEEKDGRLVSVDIADCADVSDSSRWQFVQADSTNVDYILSVASWLRDGIDVLYLDSAHRKDHVEKELTAWYPYMKQNSWIFFDDIDPQPYRKGSRKDNFRAEIAWSEIRDFVQSFFYANEDSLYLTMIYGSTGLACMHKLSPQGAIPHRAMPITQRTKTVFNLIRYSSRSALSFMQRRLFARARARDSNDRK